MHQNLPHWCVSDMPHYSMSSSTHIPVLLLLLQVTRFSFLSTSRHHIGSCAIIRGSCKDSMRARLEQRIKKSHGSICKVLDTTPIPNDNSIDMVRSCFMLIIVDVFQSSRTYLSNISCMRRHVLVVNSQVAIMQTKLLKRDVPHPFA